MLMLRLTNRVNEGIIYVNHAHYEGHLCVVSLLLSLELLNLLLGLEFE
jgi:hypothetical protein